MRRRYGTRTGDSGFTLIELMVVMLLITIVFAVTAPKLDTGILQDSRKSTTRWMKNTISDIRAAAVQKQQNYTLIINLDDGRIWYTNDSMEEEARMAAAEKAFKVPASIQFIDVQFPRKDRISTGSAEIVFYAGGYADQAAINVETDDAERFAYVIEPLLTRMKVVDEWVSY